MMLKLSAVAFFVASSVAAFPSFGGYSERLAPIISSMEADIVPDSYFVVFKDGVRAEEHSAWVQDLHKRDLHANGVWDSFTSGVKHVYDMGNFQGVAGRFRPDVLEEIRKNPAVSTSLLLSLSSLCVSKMVSFCRLYHGCFAKTSAGAAEQEGQDRPGRPHFWMRTLILHCRPHFCSFGLLLFCYVSHGQLTLLFLLGSHTYALAPSLRHRL